MTVFKLPDLGEGLQEAEIVAWHVSPGDHVVADQPLVSVETDKAVVEVPAPWSGTVRALFAEAGAVVPIGARLADINDGASSADEDSGAIVGDLPRDEPVSSKRAAAAHASAGATAVKAAPAARARAGELGIDLAALTGSGPGGVITRADVEAAVPAIEPEAGWEPLRGVRRAMARNMARARDAIALTTIFDAADINGWAAGEDITIRLVRAIAAGCRREPALNAWFDGDRMRRRLSDTVDLGIAVDTADGLFVPVLRDVAGRDAADLRKGLEHMRADIADRSIPPEELRGQTISLSNFGMLGGRHAVMTVVPPQVAILGAGRVAVEPRWRDGHVEGHRMLPLSLSFDHRAVTGAEAAHFLMAVRAALEQPSGR